MMKRSEMVKKVQDLLNGGYNPNHTDGQASDFLSELEKAGMVPPMIEDKSFTTLPNGELTYAVHEWERE